MGAVPLCCPNEEVFGFELTVTLESLLASLDDHATETVLRAAPEGTATIMFTDIEDSTELSQQLGDEAWIEVIKSHFVTLRRVVEGEGGTVVKTLGDGGMFSFGSARAALRAAASIQRAMSLQDAPPPLAVRVGIHAGDVVQDEGDYIGLTVSKAARITATVDGGQVVVSSVVAELAGNSAFQFGTPFQAELKGLDGTHQLYPVLWDEEPTRYRICADMGRLNDAPKPRWQVGVRASGVRRRRDRRLSNAWPLNPSNPPPVATIPEAHYAPKPRSRNPSC